MENGLEDEKIKIQKLSDEMEKEQDMEEWDFLSYMQDLIEA